MSVSPAEERIAQATRDLADVDLQEQIGELDHEGAERLRAIYRREIEAATQDSERPVADEPPTGRSVGRMVAGTLIVLTAVVVIGLAANRSLTERDGGFITGAAANSGTDLASISNEAMIEVIRANDGSPQINAMKLALAERYFEEGAYPDAFAWFQEVLDGNPAPPEASEALARMGWMVYASGETAVAEDTIGQALALDPNNGEALLFLGLLYLETDRPSQALDALGEVAARDDLTDEIRQLVETALAQAGAGS